MKGAPPFPAVPESVILIAGKGAYPLELARAARLAGVKRLFLCAFKGETSRDLEPLADGAVWLHLGKIDDLLKALSSTGIRHAAMAGRITPSSLFSVRFDARTLDFLRGLKVKNAETIFGTVARLLREIGVDLLPAWYFMRSAMPAPGLLTSRPPTDTERHDIALGVKVAKVTSGLDIGQTVVIKDGVVLAVEAFEGTDAAILRAGDLGGPGGVVVKVAKLGHDERFDIPVVGPRTVESMRKARASVLAVEAGRTLLLERDKLIRAAEQASISIEAVETGDERFG